MKKISIINICIFVLLTMSCKKAENFLDKAPGVDVTENTIFSSKTQLENFITTCYRYSIPSGLPERGQYNAISTTQGIASDFSMLAAGTDEAQDEKTFGNTVTNLNPGAVTPQNAVSAEDFRYYIRWTNIRQTAIVLERLNEVPSLDQTYINQVVGEMHFLRAMDYFEMMKRYGGVMLVDKRFNVGDEVNVPRSTFEQTVNFIVADLNVAIQNLPSSVPSTQAGRVTKAAAYLLKARTLLYAASPLFNTATPFLPGPGGNNKLIGYGNFDVTRWQLAADAAKATIDWCTSNGYALINDPAQRNPAYTLGQPVTGNYKYSWEVPNNSEIILAAQYYGVSTFTTFPYAGMEPSVMGGGYGGFEVLLNHVKKYEKLDGTPENWPASGGTDLDKQYAELDPRFRQSVSYNGSYWNKNYPSIATYTGGAQGKAGSGVFSGQWMKKFWPDALGNDNNSGTIPNWIVLKLDEAYLDYAEALNEAQGPTTEAYTAVNTIRARSGMPALPGGLTPDQFRTRVHNERDIELAFEEHRFFDAKRWLIAENDGVLQGTMYGLKITKNGTVLNWVPVVMSTRSFQHPYYLSPFPFSEVQKGNLIQNPGW